WYVLKKEYLQQRNHVAKSLEFHKQSRRETLINQGLYFSLLVNCQVVSLVFGGISCPTVFVSGSPETAAPPL
ncbi:MAG: hypothetical protein AAGD09_25790, partial [Cyanobacteria bacterium P01_F01_bin.56]